MCAGKRSDGDFGAHGTAYGSAAHPGATFEVAYLGPRGRNGERDPAIPVLGMPACGMYGETTVFHLVLPGAPAGDRTGEIR